MTSKQTINVKRVRFADADKVLSGLPFFSEHISDDEFVPDKQPNDDLPALPKNLSESVKSLYSISLADLPNIHRTLDHLSRSQFAHVLRQAFSSIPCRNTCRMQRTPFMIIALLREIFSARSSFPSCPAI
jgi:hypothetical protein